MKIGIASAFPAPAGCYSHALVRLLGKYLPEHEYIVDSERFGQVDIYHCFGPSLPWRMRRRSIRCVMTLHDLGFLHDRPARPLAERLFALPVRRYACRCADRIVTTCDCHRREIAEWLGIDPGRIEVLAPLAAFPPVAEAEEREREEALREKYGLPDRYILMAGAPEPRLRQDRAIALLAGAEPDAGVVIWGRRTPCADRLLAYARELHVASRVEFLYESAREELPALLRMAAGFVHLSDADAGAAAACAVEAMRAGTPMVLADTPRLRETAGEAARYVHPDAEGELESAVADLLHDEAFRRESAGLGRRRAELFGEEAVARRMAEIYASLREVSGRRKCAENS